MAIAITDEFVKDVKQHLRIFHDVDDDIIKVEVSVAASNIFDMLIQVPQKLEDGTVNPDYPTSSDDFTDRQNLAVKHLSATYRQNPDERIESKYTPQTKMVIERILGPELGYPQV